ncbi:hypothetical protein ebA3424 [Aromatoleum aromaticum EbN1]|uniref:Uncharacterized protein n=1 Tax=Aromatoleum aromaticum (strain DSM 19018 / LMG 30748 / EbN1) TaxID=76114 RepID=Q5P3Q7_AROAE|nr:hypothetical protein ebA3424 [Aromatoleum aromaticum EbN1]
MQCGDRPAARAPDHGFWHPSVVSTHCGAGCRRTAR